MLNLKTICKIIGSLLWIEATLMLTCLIVSLIYNGNDILSFIWTILITVSSGLILRLIGHNADNTIGRRDAYFFSSFFVDFILIIWHTTIYVEWVYN